MECRAAKLQLWRQNGSYDLREGLGFGSREVAGDWECEIERAEAKDLVSSAHCIESGEIVYQLG